MNIELLVQDSKSGIIYDLSDSSSSINWTTQIEEQPGKLEVSFVNTDQIKLDKGSITVLKIDNMGVFYGYLFSDSITQDDLVKIVCYDQLRYLKNKDTYVFQAMTSSQMFAQICKDKNINYRTPDSSSYACPAKLHDNKAYYEMLQDSLDTTLVKTGNWYIIRDNFGVLEHVSINSLKSDLFIGDESLLSEYDYTSSIDEDTFNKVKLIKENKATGKRDVYIVEDSSTIKRWGLLQFFEKMDENANEAQIKAQANMILKLKNRETKTLSLTCLGNLKVSAGVGIVLGIEKLKENGIPINQYYIVKACKHQFENDMHMMTLEMVVSI